MKEHERHLNESEHAVEERKLDEYKRNLSDMKRKLESVTSVAMVNPLSFILPGNCC